MGKSSPGSGDGGESSDWLGGWIRSRVRAIIRRQREEKGEESQAANKREEGRDSGGKQDGVTGREQLHATSYTNKSLDTVPSISHPE